MTMKEEVLQMMHNQCAALDQAMATFEQSGLDNAGEEMFFVHFFLFQSILVRSILIHRTKFYIIKNGS